MHGAPAQTGPPLPLQGLVRDWPGGRCPVERAAVLALWVWQPQAHQRCPLHPFHWKCSTVGAWWELLQFEQTVVGQSGDCWRG